VAAATNSCGVITQAQAGAALGQAATAGVLGKATVEGGPPPGEHVRPGRRPGWLTLAGRRPGWLTLAGRATALA
jgi:hypothetical protein